MLSRKYTYHFFVLSLLINFFSSYAFGQKDTIYTIDSNITSLGKFSAKDSIYNDIKSKKVHLFGEAKLTYEDIELNASYILFDIENKEVFASYTMKDGKRIGEPIMIQNGEEIHAGTIRFNLNSKKGYIQEVSLKQEETYLQMETAKRQQNQEIHFINGKFSTCDLEYPHYHFHLSKAILIPDKKIVSKRMNIYVRDIPTPIGLPFLVIPQTKKNVKMQRQGILIPKLAQGLPYGLGLSDFGYYYPFNDSVHTTLLGSLYSSGTWILGSQTGYKIKYLCDGDFQINMQQINSGFPDHTKSNKLSLQWRHKKDPKSNPYWNFNSNVNFLSDNQSKNTVTPNNPNYFSNTFMSDINLTRSFPNNLVRMSLKLNTNQSTTTKTMSLTSPIFTTNVTLFSPTKMLLKHRVGPDQWYDKIMISYDGTYKNSSTFADSLLRKGDYNGIKTKFTNGINQRFLISSTFKVFNQTLSLTPQINSSYTIDFQQLKKNFDTISKDVTSKMYQKTNGFYTLNFSVRMTSQIYTYYKFIGKKKALIRHIATPSISYTYTPKIPSKRDYYVDTNGKSIYYSPFASSSFSQGNTNASSMLNFDLMNTFELKTKSAKDTITGYKKTKLIDAFSLSGNYDFLKDSMKLSTITANIRINPLPFISIVHSSFFSPYGWNPITGSTIGRYAIQNNQSLGRFLNHSINTTLTITSERSRKKIQENKEAFSGIWNSELRYYSLHPEEFLDFQIPWKVNISHVFSVDVNTNRNINNAQKHLFTNTINADGDISLTKRWKVSNRTNFDYQTKKITNTNFTITRNLHCWNLSFNFTPIGYYKSFLVRLAANATLLQDAKLELRKPPSVF